MKKSILISLLLLILVIDLSSPHFWRRRRTQRKINKVKVSPLTSVLCRLRHHKTILNENNKPVACKRKCPTNFRESYSLNWGHHCKPIVIPQGCADEYCIRCVSGYKWIFAFPYQERCIKNCPPGFITSGTTCEKCSIDDCVSCSSHWTCRKCSSGLALYKTYMESTICVYMCPLRYEKVNVNGVDTCIVKGSRTTTTEAPTTIITQTITAEETTMMTTTDQSETSQPTATVIRPTAEKTTKIVLPEGCKDINCVICQQGYFKYFPPTKGSYCLKQCPTGYTALGSLCVACADRRCASCKASLAECDRCFPGYFMLLDSSNITLECVRTCPEGYESRKINDVKMCLITPEPECPITNCLRCVGSKLHSLHTGCKECRRGYKLFRGSFNDHCYTSCPPGHFEATKPGTNITTCAQCITPFCNKCSNENICSECVAPMVLDLATRRCTICPPLKEYSFEVKDCVNADLNQPESNNIFDV